MPADVTYVSGPRIERVMGPDRRYTGETKIVLGIAYGKRETHHLVELTERDLLSIAAGAVAALEQLRRYREDNHLPRDRTHELAAEASDTPGMVEVDGDALHDAIAEAIGENAAADIWATYEARTKGNGPTPH